MEFIRRGQRMGMIFHCHLLPCKPIRVCSLKRGMLGALFRSYQIYSRRCLDALITTCIKFKLLSIINHLSGRVRVGGVRMRMEIDHELLKIINSACF
jgi:hypothetical protein